MLIFEEQLIVDIPEAFRMMTIDRIDGMYPCDEKPQIILEDEETHRFCTFSLFEGQILFDQQVEYAIRLISRTVISLYPSSLLEDVELLNCKEGRCGWFSFRTMWDQDWLYNVMYIYPVNSRMMFGTRGCGIGDGPGKEQFKAVMGSLHAVRKSSPHRILGKEPYRCRI